MIFSCFQRAFKLATHVLCAFLQFSAPWEEKQPPTGLTLSDILLYNAPIIKKGGAPVAQYRHGKKRLAAWLLLAAVLLAAVVYYLIYRSKNTRE